MLSLMLVFLAGGQPAPKPSPYAIFDKPNLVAWCVVPFDAKKRGPAERAAMLKTLGIKRLAYDWRDEHIATFDAELKALKDNKIEMTAFWFPGAVAGTGEKILAALDRFNVRTQLWVSMPDPGPAGDNLAKAARVAQQLRGVAVEAGKRGHKLGLYNHGGWAGEPENMLLVREALGMPHVGIVYNLHHAHGALERLPAVLPRLVPHLLCWNINGTDPRGDAVGRKILPMAQGSEDERLTRLIAESGYRGLVGVLGHTSFDAADTLADNLDGLAYVVLRAKGADAGEAPKPRTPVPPRPGAGATSDAGWLVPGMPAWREWPMTAEVNATVRDAANFRVLMASDTKASGRHWEIFTYPGTGRVAAYLPGFKPDHVNSETVITDGKPHTVGLVIRENGVTLYVDGRQVVQGDNRPTGAVALAGPLGLGRLAEGGLDAGGMVAWARIRKGAQVPHGSSMVPAKDPTTLGLWVLDAKKEACEDLSGLAGPARRALAAQASNRLPPKYDLQRIKTVLASAQTKGDMKRGAKVFASARHACLNCHKVGAHGGIIGPDLTEVGKCQPAEVIVENVLYPSHSIKQGYLAHALATADGKVLQGYLVSENPKTVVIREAATGKESAIPRADIEELKPVGSLMPAGLAEAMTEADLTDLCRFLVDLGRDPAVAGALPGPAIVHKATEFEFARGPIDPSSWPLADQFPNRERLYDFYQKEAIHFAAMKTRPAVAMAFPGLESGKHGHWGNQNEEYWKGAEWTKADVSPVLGGVFRAPGVTVRRGVCVLLGDKGEMAACFNPETLCYEALWKGGFLKLGEIRHGFMDGIKPDGSMLPRPEGTKPAKPFIYKGYYRHGKRVVFSYTIDGTHYLDSAWVENGQFKRELVQAAAANHSMNRYTAGGPARWPERLPVVGQLGKGGPYAIDTIPVPFKNPWNSPIFPGDLAFLPDGAMLVCSMQGDVWRIDSIDAGLKAPVWRKVASGLHQPLGMVVVDGDPMVLGRDQITRLRDLNGDGEYDFHECFCNAYETSTGGHDFICGLQRAADGSYVIASSNQGVMRISPDGATATVLATGFRNPDGVGIAADGAITVPCSEGDWTPASMICQIRPNGFYGYGGPRGGKSPDLPLVYLPRGLDNSAGGQATIDSSRWGPFKGLDLHFSFGACSHFLLLRDTVDGQPQGALVPMPGEFISGAHRGRFSPADGQLYVVGMQGWGTYALADGGVQRVRYTGEPVQAPIAFRMHANGIHLKFAQPIDPSSISQQANRLVMVWNYRYGPAYGSAEYSSHHVGLKGHDILEVTGAHVTDGGTGVFLEVPDLQPANQVQVFLKTGSGKPTHLFATAHRLAADYTGIPGYVARPKTIMPHPILTDLAVAVKSVPNRWRYPMAGARKITIDSGPNLSFQQKVLSAKAGEVLALTFTNPDVVPHNWALLKPGSLARVGAEANLLVSDPEALARHYIPAGDDVLAHTDVVAPGERFTIYFQVPKAKGRYPYVCTFPGHWMVMNGNLVVE